MNNINTRTAAWSFLAPTVQCPSIREQLAGKMQSINHTPDGLHRTSGGPSLRSAGSKTCYFWANQKNAGGPTRTASIHIITLESSRAGFEKSKKLVESPCFHDLISTSSSTIQQLAPKWKAFRLCFGIYNLPDPPLCLVSNI